MRFGPNLPKGFLPVFSVGSEEEAHRLIVATCPRDIDGTYYSRELVEEQTLENLEAFSTKIDMAHDRLVAAGQCTCDLTPRPEPEPKKRRAPRRRR